MVGTLCPGVAPSKHICMYADKYGAFGHCGGGLLPFGKPRQQTRAGVTAHLSFAAVVPYSLLVLWCWGASGYARSAGPQHPCGTIASSGLWQWIDTRGQPLAQRSIRIISVGRVCSRLCGYTVTSSCVGVGQHAAWTCPSAVQINSMRTYISYSGQSDIQSFEPVPSCSTVPRCGSVLQVATHQRWGPPPRRLEAYIYE